MTRDEAIAYINAHPSQFKGASQEEILSKTQSSNDPNYYNPTLYTPEQKRTVVKPNTPTRGATVSTPKASSTTVPKSTAANTPQSSLPASNALIGKLKGPNALPWVLGFLTIGLGAGMALYKASR